MRKFFVAFAGLLAACFTPAYRASEVPVPAAYNVDDNPSIVANRAQTSRSQDVSASGVYASPTLASAPFWTELGDSTLTMLVREGQRANMDVRIAQSRVQSARATRRLAALDLIPTVTGTGSTSRSQLSLATTPGLTSQLPTQSLWDVGFDASWESISSAASGATSELRARSPNHRNAASRTSR